MAEHNDLGNLGESIARKHLQRKGYKLLEANWRFGKDEIDIIAVDKNQLVIVEVKTRSNRELGEPEEAVNKKKQKFLVRAADVYITENNIEMDCRFDIIAIIYQNSKAEINHIVDAFYPTL